jgi:hypothetical protein
MSENDKLKYHRHLEAIVHADVEYVRRKDAQYDARVGRSAMVLAPFSRLSDRGIGSKVSADRLDMMFSPRFAKRASRGPTGA